MRKLPRSFYDRDTVQVAQELLGKHLVRVVDGVERVGRIVEVEAYLGPHDLAGSDGQVERSQRRSAGKGDHDAGEAGGVRRSGVAVVVRPSHGRAGTGS